MDAVLDAVARLALAGGRRIVEPAVVAVACEGAGLPVDRWLPDLLALHDRGLVQARTSDGGHLLLLAVTDAGLLDHLARTRPDLDDVRARLWAAVVAAPPGAAVALQDGVGEPPLLVEVLLDDWVRRRRLIYAKATGRRFRVHRVLPGTASPAAEAAAGGPAAPEPA
jgi:hypothetical protein